MSATCNMCSSKITKERFPGVKCGGSCDNFFHITCAQISKQLLEGIKNRSANWLCEECRPTANKTIVDIDDDHIDSANNINLTDIMNQLKRMEKKLSSFEELKGNYMSLQSDNQALQVKVQKLEEQLLIHNNKLHLIEANNDKPNQLQNETNIIIRGLPLKHGDTGGLIINTLSKIGVSTEANDIVSIKPMNKQFKKTSTLPNKTLTSLQEFFIVKLKSTDLKNNILSQMRKIKSLSTKDLDTILPLNHPEQRIFIMHHLTAFQSKLYREAKIIKTKFIYKYLWCKNGQIYLRKTAESDVHRIQSYNDIFRLNHQEIPVDVTSITDDQTDG